MSIRRYAGDVYVKKATSKGHDYWQYHIGSPNGRFFMGGTKNEELMIYLLAHLGQTFTREELLRAANTTCSGLENVLHSLRRYFEDSKCFEFTTIRQGRTAWCGFTLKNHKKAA